MKQIFLCSLCLAILSSCNNSKTESATAGTASDTTFKTTLDLPYTASYSSNFNEDVSDADLKTVMVSYKEWADGNMANVAKQYADTLEWDRTSGEHYKLPNAEVMKMWTTYRDSLASVTIDMQGWKKMYSVDKKMAWVAAWYKEIDTYKSGKVDSGYYHDLNLMVDGKISLLEQYKRAAK